jgi:O-acetyl-ADP-ribose deacetylase (regulator of RNase III)
MTMVTGDIFLSSSQTLVNPVNCVGVMGKGLAREFRRRFPDMYDDYTKRCAGATVRLGEPYLMTANMATPLPRARSVSGTCPGFSQLGVSCASTFSTASAHDLAV